jgi:hypothetical protein
MDSSDPLEEEGSAQSDPYIVFGLPAGRYLVFRLVFTTYGIRYTNTNYFFNGCTGVGCGLTEVG